MKAWKFWILVVLAVSGPWFGFLSRPQWNRVTWIPFHGKEDKPRDVLANFLLYVPLGWSFASSRRRSSHAIAASVALSALVSLSAETAQLFFRLRDPSATDVVMAMVGTAAGSFGFYARDRGSRQP